LACARARLEKIVNKSKKILKKLEKLCINQNIRENVAEKLNFCAEKVLYEVPLHNSNQIKVNFVLLASN